MSRGHLETYMSDSDSTVSIPNLYSDSESVGSREDIVLDIPADTDDVHLSLLDIDDAYDDDVVRLYRRNRVLQTLCELRIYPHVLTSATVIQTAYRRHRRRMLLRATQDRRIVSSIRIQRVMRGYMARNRPAAGAIVRLQNQRIRILRLELALLHLTKVQPSRGQHDSASLVESAKTMADLWTRRRISAVPQPSAKSHKRARPHVKLLDSSAEVRRADCHNCPPTVTTSTRNVTMLSNQTTPHHHC